MTDYLLIQVIGTPAPQGSKRHVGNGILVESSKKVKPWRQDVRQAALDAREQAGHETFTGPVAVTLAFTFPHPKSHYRTGRYAHLLRDHAPEHVSTRPDLDKCLRSTLDALGEAGCWRDDAQVSTVEMSKRYGSLGGATVFIRDITEAES